MDKTTIQFPNGVMIRKFRAIKKLTLLNFARSIGLRSPSQISGWENGLHSPSYENIMKIKQVHGLDLTSKKDFATSKYDIFEAFEDQENDDDYFVADTNEGGIKAQAISFMTLNSNVVSKIKVEQSLLNFFNLGEIKKITIVEVVGDAMSPEIYPGDLVVIDENENSISVGPLFLVRTSEGAILRRFVNIKDQMMMICRNKNYPALEVDNIDDFQVIGRVARLIRMSKL